MQSTLSGFSTRSPDRSRRVIATARRAVAVAAAGVVGLLTAPAVADMADHVPSDALAVLRVRSLQEVSDNFAALATEWGLDQAVDPAMADPLGSFRAEMGIEAGVNFNGDGGFYLAGQMLDESEPPLVLLIPVNDYEAFLTNLQDVQTEGDISTGSLGDGPPVFVTQRGDYAAVSPFRELVAAGVEDAISLSGPTADRVEDRDLSFYANFDRLGPMLTSMYQEEGVRDEVLGEFRREFDNEAPDRVKPFKPVIEAVINQGFNVAESFLRDAEAATISVDLKPESGISTNVIAQFKGGSYLANTFGDLEATDDSMLSGLPEAKYLMFGGSVADPEQGTEFYNDLAGPIIDALLEVEDGGELQEIFAQYAENIQTMIGASEGSRFGVFTPPPGIGGGALIQQVTVQKGDADALMGATMNFAKTAPEFMQAMAQLTEAPAGQMPEIEFVVEENAKTVAGVSFTKLSSQLPAGDPQMAMAMNMIFGPEGQTQYLATVGENLVSVSGLNDQQIASVVQALEADSDALGDLDTLNVVDENLPSQRSAVAYIGVGEIARTGLGFAQMFGALPPVQLPQDLPPVGVTVGPEDDSLQIATFVPKDLVSAIIVAALEVNEGMNGGNRGL